MEYSSLQFLDKPIQFVHSRKSLYSKIRCLWWPFNKWGFVNQQSCNQVTKAKSQASLKLQSPSLKSSRKS
jgi:hypothetical protein